VEQNVNGSNARGVPTEFSEQIFYKLLFSQYKKTDQLNSQVSDYAASAKCMHFFAPLMKKVSQF
jgi:hypothetical protein